MRSIVFASLVAATIATPTSATAQSRVENFTKLPRSGTEMSVAECKWMLCTITETKHDVLGPVLGVKVTTKTRHEAICVPNEEVSYASAETICEFYQPGVTKTRSFFQYTGATPPR